MTDAIAIATAPGSVENVPPEARMATLAARLAAVVPPAPVTPLDNGIALPRPSATVQAALARAQANARRAARRARPRSIIATLADAFIALCSFVTPYALVGLGLRLIMARVFFFDGQTKIIGPIVPLSIPTDLLRMIPIDLSWIDYSVILPLQVKADTFTAFLTRYTAVPVPPMFGAYLVSYAEFLLPILLVLGFATRFAALGLLIITAMIQLYVLPDALWSTHIYWIAMLAVLMSIGPGAISVDHIVRLIARR
jgi:putative oxidoreductase